MADNSTMKILHTADWHIGKTLHKHPLQDQLLLFFDWLCELIEKERIDLLLISGDVFDVANPATADRRMYFQFLKRLNDFNLQVIITGGNHDSVGQLNAPKEVLEVLNVTVIGGATEDLKDELVEVRGAHGNTKLVVAAVPFLRDKDLRHRDSDEKYENRTEAIREGIKLHYAALADQAKDHYPNIPALAMGHLFTLGADPSESERDIHIGNTAAINASAFPAHFQYVALGHIHRPQIIGGNEMIRYSGSPIPLSFSEKNDQKTVLIVELQNGQLSSPQVIPVPAFRQLKKFSGSLEVVRKKLTDYRPEFQLSSFVEIEVTEPVFSSLIIGEVEGLKNEFEEGANFRILKTRTHFETGTKDTADLFSKSDSIEDLNPKDVFARKLEAEGIDEETTTLLMQAFQELVENAEAEDAP